MDTRKIESKVSRGTMCETKNIPSSPKGIIKNYTNNKVRSFPSPNSSSFCSFVPLEKTYRAVRYGKTPCTSDANKSDFLKLRASYETVPAHCGDKWDYCRVTQRLQILNDKWEALGDRRRIAVLVNPPPKPCTPRDATLPAHTSEHFNYKKYVENRLYEHNARWSNPSFTSPDGNVN